MAQKKFITLAVVVAALAFIIFSHSQRESRRESARLALIPQMLPSVYPPEGKCVEVESERRPLYLYYVDGERAASRSKPEGMDCRRRQADAPQTNRLEGSVAGSQATDTGLVLDELLLQISNRVNETLPRRVDRYTTLDTTYATGGGEFTYAYTLDHVDSSSVSSEDLQDQIGPSVIAHTCDVHIETLDDGATIIHRYRGNDGKLIGEVHVQLSSCDN